MHKFITKETPAKRAQHPPSGIPSSSPAFGTPGHTLKDFTATPAGAPPALAPAGGAARPAILPIVLPPAALRPLAFRTFTKKHSLTLTSSSLSELASFIGRHCGSGWREEGLAEKVLEEVARSWKNRNGGVIVDGGSAELKGILTTLEAGMSGGKIIAGGRGGGLSRQNSLMLDGGQEPDLANVRMGLPPSRAVLRRGESEKSFGMSGLEVDDEIDDEALNDVRKWLKVINAGEQPRFVYNVDKKHFERETTKPSIMPSPARKTLAFRTRFNVIHQRLLRHESFNQSSIPTIRTAHRKPGTSQSLKITPIANMLGRHGTQQMLLGMLSVLPTGDLAIADLTGTITVDLARAVDYPRDSAWYTPGMIVLVDGIYEEEDETSSGKGLGGARGVGGLLGGKFTATFIGHLSCETRSTSLGVTGPHAQEQAIGGGFGWIDFLGVGSERAVGQKMRRVEQRLTRQVAAEEARDRARMVVLGELNLDDPRTLPALRKVLSLYAAEEEQAAPPVCFVLMGNFVSQPVMARGRGRGSVEYKEYFDELGTVLAEFPSLVKSCTFIFVPGDNDAWISAGATGAASPLPRKPVPELFTSRIRRLFSAAAGDQARAAPEAVWASNPSRLSLFGPNHEVVLFRDDVLGRLQRNAVVVGEKNEQASGFDGEDEDVTMTPAVDSSQPDGGDSMDVDAEGGDAQDDKAAAQRTAQRLVKTIVDQGYLSPFHPTIRPVHWDYSWALHLYPLPSALVVMDSTAPAFCLTYGRCHVMNPGSILMPDRRGVARWIEYRMGSTGEVRTCNF